VRRIAVAVALALTAVVLAAGTATAAVPFAYATVTVSAHRGGAGQWPENSMLAFSRTAAAGYDEIEADAWLTEDGQAVIYHDPWISASRCTAFHGQWIDQLTAAQVAQVRCSGQAIPTEAALVALVRAHPRLTLRLEVKHPPGQSAAGAWATARIIARAVVAQGIAGRTIMQDFYWTGLRAIHATYPQLRLSALIDHPTAADVRTAHALGAYDLSYRAKYETAALDGYISYEHLVPTVWAGDAPVTGPLTAGDQTAIVSAFCRAAAAGVRVYITNFPAIVTAARSRRGSCGAGRL